MSFFSQLTILECASVLAGPAVGAMFAELGATVIKLEPLSGDVTRSWKLPGEPAADGVSAYFSCVNWGKRSLAVNLKTPEGRLIAQGLAARADVLIANYKPGAAARLGLDAASLRARNDRLIYAHLTGYGPDDPRTGYDALIQAESGFLQLNGRPGEEPVKLPVALIDLLAAHQLKEAILVALIERLHDGQGRTIEISLMASALASLANQASNWLVAGQRPAPMGLEHPNIVPYGSLYETADGGRIMLAIGSDRQFIALARLLGAPDLATDPRFARNADRVVHRQALQASLIPLIRGHATQALLTALWQQDLPAGEVNDIPQALAQPAATALQLNAGSLSGLRTCVFSRGQLSPPPALGADSAALLQELLGYDEERCAQLMRQNIIGSYKNC